MVVEKFIGDDGKVIMSYIDENLKKNLDKIKYSVLHRSWDYVCVISGIPGVGKSTLGQVIAKYLDPTFTTKNNFCLTGDGKNGLIERTIKSKLVQAYILDESFESLNTRVTRSPEFIRILNHLQLIRQKGLFIILILPDFFSLSKNIAIFRASHLFSVYHDKYQRGYFAAFGRPEKRMLYIKGNKYIDYNCVPPNFRGRYVQKWVADQKLYDKLKLNHLYEQNKRKEKLDSKPDTISRNKLIKAMRDKGTSTMDIAKICGVTQQTIYNALKTFEDESQKSKSES